VRRGEGAEQSHHGRMLKKKKPETWGVGGRVTVFQTSCKRPGKDCQKKAGGSKQLARDSKKSSFPGKKNGTKERRRTQKGFQGCEKVEETTMAAVGKRKLASGKGKKLGGKTGYRCRGGLGHSGCENGEQEKEEQPRVKTVLTQKKLRKKKKRTGLGGKGG